MADALARIQGRQARDEDEALTQADNQNQWANFFVSTPPTEQLRARVNLADMVSKAVEGKQRLLAQSDLKSQALYFNQKKFEQYQEDAPVRHRILEAQLAATGAAERRKALEAETQANHTARLNNGMLKLYQSGSGRDTPEFKTGVVNLLADNPFADIEQVAELGKFAGFSNDLKPEDYIKTATALKKAAQDAGMTNPQVRAFQGRPTVIEGAPIVTDEQKIEQAVARKKALQAVPDAPGGGKPDSYKAYNDDLTEAKAAYTTQATTDYKDSGGLPPFLQKAFEARGKQLEAQATGAAPATAAPERTATNPQTGEKVVFRGGKWVPL